MGSDAPMGKFERQLRDLMSSFRSVWRWRARSGPDDPRARGGRPRPHPRDLPRRDAGHKAEETLRDLRSSDTARKAQSRVREFRTSETGRKAEATIQEAEAAARAAYLRLRKSMGEDK